MKLALVHDVAEAIVGDITPTCGVSDEEKYALEAGAVGRIKAMLGGAGCLPGELRLPSVAEAVEAESDLPVGVAGEMHGAARAVALPVAPEQQGCSRSLAASAASCPAAEEIEALWHEYEQGQTAEARLVKDFDKVGGRRGVACASADWSGAQLC